MDRAGQKPGDLTGQHIRGSSLLLAGRGISLVLNFLSQVLIVRYLTKGDYGAFAFVLAFVQGVAAVNVFGFHKTVARFLSIYQERGEFGKMFGAIAFALASLLALGLAAVLLVLAFPGPIDRALNAAPLTASLIPFLILQLPAEAADLLLVQLLAVYAGARSIFFRRHVLGPSLRFAAIVAVIALGGDVFALALAYVGASALGIAIYAGVLVHVLRRKSLLRHFRWKTLEFPVREILGFSMPLVSSDFLFLARSSLVLYLLEYFHPTTSVAEYRAVVPVARLATVVQSNFLPLFLPLAARLFSRNDREGIERMHWQTSIWVLVLTFPIFATCVALARPLTIALFGARYADSAPILALLALGNYAYATFAFNVETLKVLGKIRFVVAGDVVATAAALVLNFSLIPAYGPVGAAAAVAATMLVYSIVDQALLKRAAGISFVDARFAKAGGLVAAGLAVVGLVQWTLSPPLAVGAGLVAAVSVLLLRLCRNLMRLDETFPELARVPIVGRWLAGASDR